MWRVLWMWLLSLLLICDISAKNSSQDVEYVLQAMSTLMDPKADEYEFSDLVNGSMIESVAVWIVQEHNLSSKAALESFSAQHNVSLLMLSSFLGQAEIISSILNTSTANLDQDYNYAHNAAPLHVAIAGGHREAVHVLVQAWANVDIATWVLPPLIIAIAIENLEILKYLIEAGADVNVSVMNGRTPLHFATFAGSEIMVSMLVEAKANVDPLDNGDLTPLLFGLFLIEANDKNISSVNVAGYDEVMILLIDAGADVNIRSPGTGKVPLHYAAAAARIDIVTKLLNDGADPNIVDNVLGDTPLTSAYRWGWDKPNAAVYTNILYMFLEYGADPNLSNSIYGTALPVAALVDKDEEITEMLIKYGASDIESSTSMFLSSLYGSLLARNNAIAKLILKNEVDPNFTDLSGDSCSTTLIVAIRMGDFEIVRELMSRGADPTQRMKHCDKSSKSELYWLISYMDDLYTEDEAAEIFEMLVDAGADVNEELLLLTDLDLLLLSMLSNYTKICIDLIDKGFNIYQEPPSMVVGYLSQALRQENCAVAEKLIQKNVKIQTYDLGGLNSIFNLSHTCTNASRMILQRIPHVDKPNNENMTVDLGDELVYNLYPELGHNVVVINWKEFQWFSYSLDTQAVNMFKNSTLNNTVVAMFVTAPYPHPFLFMTDFRQHLLNHISKDTTNMTCQADILAAPDVFTLIKDKITDVENAIKFYSPVLESLDVKEYEESCVETFTKNVFLIFFSSLAIFGICTIPLHIILYAWCKQSPLIEQKENNKQKQKKGKRDNEEVKTERKKCKCKQLDGEEKLRTDEKDLNSSCLNPNRISLIAPITFYIVLGLANLILYQVAKKSINWLVELAIRISSYNSSLWLILIFKFLNTLVLDYQPGSICAGQIYASEQNLRLAFWLSDHEDPEYQEQRNKTLRLEFKTEKYSRKFQALVDAGYPDNLDDPDMTEEFRNSSVISLNSTEIASWKFLEHLINQYNASHQSFVHERRKTRKIANKLNKKNPMKIWTSNWLNNGDWTQLQFVDNASLASSAVFHLAYIALFHKFNIFKKFQKIWKYGSRSKRLLCLLLVSIAAATNLGSKLISFSPSTSVFLHLVILRLILLAIITPSSVILEWIAFQCFLVYISFWKSLLLSSFCSSTISRDMTQKYLEFLALKNEEMENVRIIVNDLYQSVKTQLEMKSRHTAELVPTGSIFEGYGKPLNFPQLSSNLGTDFDIMFAFRKEDLEVEFIMKDHEFLYISALTSNCSLLNQLQMYDEGSQAHKLSSVKAREMMKHVVNSTSEMQQNLFQSFIQNLFPFLFNIPHLSKFKINQTKLSGTAAHYSVLEGNLYKAQDWHKTMDCDFLLSIELGEWPATARDWMTLNRNWPTAEVVKQVIQSGCQAVPKADLTNDQLCWRLSFSRGEQILSKHVPANARLAFLAVKLAWKQGLKPACSKLKSYHIKTMFYHFLENSTREALEENGLDTIYKSLIHFMVESLKKMHIPHFFIRAVNLMAKDPMTSKEISDCVTFFKKLEKQEIQNVFCSNSKSEMMIQQFRQNHFCLHMLGTVFLIIANAVVTCAGAQGCTKCGILVVGLAAKIRSGSQFLAGP